MCTLSLKPIFERLGERDTTALLALHTVTGSDHLGRFASISKLTCWKFLQPVSGEVQSAFSELGKGSIPSHVTKDKIEQYLCQLYDPGN